MYLHPNSTRPTTILIKMGADVAIKHGPPRLLLQQRKCAYGILLFSPVEHLGGNCTYIMSYSLVPK